MLQVVYHYVKIYMISAIIKYRLVKYMRNKKRAIFGETIEVSCEYCQNGRRNDDNFVCLAKKTIKNGKCKKFIYDPILRIPKGINPNMQEFTPEDFKIE